MYVYSHNRSKLFAIIMFAAMADQQGYSSVSEMQYLVAMGVITWLYIWFIIIAHIMDLHSRTVLSSGVNWLILGEFVSDCVLALLDIIAGIAVAAYCNKTVSGTNITYCQYVDKPKAATACSFFVCWYCCVCLLGDKKE